MRNSSGGGEKDTNKPDTIVSMHLTYDSNNDSDDDDNGSVESFESNDSNNGRSNSDKESVADKPITTSELEDDITGGVVTTNNDNNDDNSINDDGSNDASNDGSDGDASDSDDKSYTLATKTEDNENAHWMSYLAMVNKNIENGINSDIVDSSPNKWIDLQSMTISVALSCN